MKGLVKWSPVEITVLYMWSKVSKLLAVCTRRVSLGNELHSPFSQTVKFISIYVLQWQFAISPCKTPNFCFKDHNCTSLDNFFLHFSGVIRLDEVWLMNDFFLRTPHVLRIAWKKRNTSTRINSHAGTPWNCGQMPWSSLSRNNVSIRAAYQSLNFTHPYCSGVCPDDGVHSFIVTSKKNAEL